MSGNWDAFIKGVEEFHKWVEEQNEINGHNKTNEEKEMKEKLLSLMELVEGEVYSLEVDDNLYRVHNKEIEFLSQDGQWKTSALRSLNVNEKVFKRKPKKVEVVRYVEDCVIDGLMTGNHLTGAIIFANHNRGRNKVTITFED